MTVSVHATGAAADAVARVLPQLVSDSVASRITVQDPTLWGPEAEAESAIRLGWTEAVAVSRSLVDDILALRERLNDNGIDRIVLCGMGGSSLAPEVICATYGVSLVVLDATWPGQVRRAISDDIERTAVVVSSKSGSTLETDSQRRAFEQAFRDVGVDPVDRIIVVTDPGSPLDVSARGAGYRVFNADPNVGGRYSALTAFGLVPSGLAGVDIAQLLDEAEGVSLELAMDDERNPGLVLGAAIAGTRPLRDKLGIIADGTHIVGFADWAEQLIAESTGKGGTGLLPVVLGWTAPELSAELPDLQVVRLVADGRATEDVEEGEIEVAGTLGGQIMVWEYATAIAGRILGINPFDQPDVESAKIAARGMLDNRPAPIEPAFVDGSVEIRPLGGLDLNATDLTGALRELVAAVGPDGYIAVQAYLDREDMADLTDLRDLLAARSGRPVTFGWGPRFLHSTGQFHKGGPAVGVFLQLLGVPTEELGIPGRPFGFGELIRAQAAGDAAVLAGHGRPVLALTLTDLTAGASQLRAALT